MENEEIKKRLDFFAEFLDNMRPSFDKGTLSGIFTGYAECYNKLLYYEHIMKNKEIK